MSDLELTLERLRNAYDNPEYAKGLNTALRKALRLFAAAARLDFVQDNAGNIHIWKHGRDPELANIAIAFQLDESRSRASCESAFRLFHQLQRENLLCGLTLLGWTSVGVDYLGRDLWETGGYIPTKKQVQPELEQFSTFEDVSKFQLSAVFEVAETQDIPLEAEGAPVLIEHVKKVATSAVASRPTTRKQMRAPEIRIKGQNAETIGFEAIKTYSAYVGALFDNFD
ncbi:uncharacterized protein Z520_08337 [Fonsecaea multimorphosa CBS 102226]|uniref:Uncharacterized protein n=1 Tax=Fonsecaea multimorphosa CBS 102226 TaxID=1442371 RepID=A0A0D2JRL8_9EURO|nr:uncharacterized protein Z520_08337 [Fonsecaea multimorphosa CBS 102226]KIX96082.1 hypothetical protein Z520_08337 [Fonsecaea multimorphosa CBS 102226]OAL21848.1 hypothetical protein AYO22_07790 [Fonsecaea multimorphosa]